MQAMICGSTKKKFRVGLVSCPHRVFNTLMQAILLGVDCLLINARLNVDPQGQALNNTSS